MPKDSRVDAYIASSADFAKPILTHLRTVVHRAHPAVQETMKWGMPHFEHNGILCSMAAFKKHCAFGFWKGSLIVGRGKNAEAMGQFGRIVSLADLPKDEVLARYVKEAVRLNEAGVKLPARRKTGAPRKPVVVPPALAAALTTHPKARAAFEAMSPSQRREYAEWIAEAKTDATRDRRLATALEWIAEGKPRNWKYMRSVQRRVAR
jgi:hypothetical protein